MKLILKGIDLAEYTRFRDDDFKGLQEAYSAEVGKSLTREMTSFASVPDLSSDATGSLSARYLLTFCFFPFRLSSFRLY